MLSRLYKFGGPTLPHVNETKTGTSKLRFQIKAQNMHRGITYALEGTKETGIKRTQVAYDVPRYCSFDSSLRETTTSTGYSSCKY